MANYRMEKNIHVNRDRNNLSKPKKSIKQVVAYRYGIKYDEEDYRYKNNQHDITSLFLINQNNNIKIYQKEENIELIKEYYNVLENKYENRYISQLCEEYVITLQNELNLEQNLEVVVKFCKNNFLKNNYTADISVHLKNGNPHCHVVVPLRKVLNFEKDNMIFEKTKKVSNPNPEIRKQELKAQREDLANEFNKVFKNNNINIELSAKSLKAQREEAIKNKNYVKFLKLCYKPAKYIPRAKSKAQKEKEELLKKLEQDYLIATKKEKELLEIEMILLKQQIEDLMFKNILKKRKEIREQEIAEFILKIQKEKEYQFILNDALVKKEFKHLLKETKRQEKENKIKMEYPKYKPKFI